MGGHPYSARGCQAENPHPMSQSYWAKQLGWTLAMDHVLTF